MRVAVCLLLFATTAQAEDWRPYVFSVVGDTLAAKHAVIENGLGYNGLTGTGGGLSPDSSHRVQFWLASAVGITNWLTFDGALQFADDSQNFGFSQARLDLRARVVKKGPFAMSLGLGYQADTLLQNAVTGVVALSLDLGRFDLTLNLRAAHYFHPGRDPVDFFLTFGALVRTTRWLYLGVEYVGEELEAAFDDDEVEVGGVGRHYLGATGVLRFWENRIRVNATVGAVIMSQRPIPGIEPGLDVGPLVRGSFAYLF